MADSFVVTSTETLSPANIKTQSIKQLDVVLEDLGSAQLTIDGFKLKDPVCNTKECVVSAAALMEAMDPSVDPCQDFYQFTCGGWLRKNSIPETSSRWGHFNILREQVTHLLKEVLTESNAMRDSKPVNNSRDMYKACMDTDAVEILGLTPLTEILDSYGRWPMTVSNWTADQFDWRSVSSSIRKNFGESFLFEVYNYLDWKDTNKSSIYVDQSGLGLPYSTLINAKSNSTAAVMKAYANYVIETAKAVRDTIQGGSNDSDITRQVEQMIDFQIELAKIQTKPEMRRNRTRMYNPMRLDALQRWTNVVHLTRSTNYVKIKWADYISDIYSVVNISVTENEQVVVTEPEFLRKLVRLLDQTSPRVIGMSSTWKNRQSTNILNCQANYIHWRLVMKAGDNTNQLMNSIAFKFWKVFYGASEPQPRWRFCVNKVANTLGFAVGTMYVERAFDEHAKKEAIEMIGHLKEAFSSLVEKSQWMDPETKIRALEKAAAMKEFVAYPDWILNKTQLTLAYEGVEINSNSHFENYLNVTRFLEYGEMKGLRLPTDRTTWVTFPSVVNAFYYFFYNSITFPAGILQPPFFGKGRLAALNYGGIGAVIGHEITHGFDDHGRQTDKDGRVNLWWTNQTLTKYLQGAQCFVEQYGNYTFPEFAGTEAFHINGIISQGENIADNGGVREAFLAYQNYVALNGREARLPGLEQYTPEQLFFISYGNIWCGKQTPQSLKQHILNGPHSPERYRVLGTLSNSVDFSRHFKCSKDSAMNRPNKCILW
ncbi:hypothetical protein DAPPUDRAFT_304103 [Daphnia pulex]|uniref:Uncharacterized protein n=1 Tax=Daphnia pulex TaxID=6669 RepID=E9GJ71_DAPPU|nr:hypothetical protein DAPPUDRAFT_304103 [Daphnia pulex]|eukprot:EFX80396.1 hypothetical protein DAPPUDRAFT_304103 [Daphnia pulex]